MFRPTTSQDIVGKGDVKDVTHDVLVLVKYRELNARDLDGQQNACGNTSYARTYNGDLHC
jgi:hypothetical protein